MRIFDSFSQVVWKKKIPKLMADIFVHSVWKHSVCLQKNQKGHFPVCHRLKQGIYSLWGDVKTSMHVVS